MNEESLHRDAEEIVARWRRCCFRQGAPGLKEWWDAMNARPEDALAIGPPPCPICNPTFAGAAGPPH